ncbi:hypothetical protein ENBRE01_1389 [Enteropsectra breve]|nr:hypothetical protein ENBRE01_1389 [Enteropsectra breve]
MNNNPFFKSHQMNKMIIPLLVLVLIALIASAIGLICFSISSLNKKLCFKSAVISKEHPRVKTEFIPVRPETTKDDKKSSNDESQQTISSLFCTNNYSGLSVCEFLTCCPEFKEAVKNATLEKNNLILKDIQTFVQEDGKLSSDEEYVIADRIGRYTLSNVYFNEMLNNMSEEQNDIVDPHFKFRFLHMNPRPKFDPNIIRMSTSKPLYRLLFSYHELQYFRDINTDKKHPKIFEVLVNDALVISYNPDSIMYIEYPSCLIFALDDNSRNGTLVTNFAIPKSTDAGKKYIYRIKAALVKDDDDVVRVMKSKDGSKIYKLSAEDSKFIMERAFKILYEREEVLSP